MSQRERAGEWGERGKGGEEQRGEEMCKKRDRKNEIDRIGKGEKRKVNTIKKENPSGLF